jgi:hypothetical protein
MSIKTARDLVYERSGGMCEIAIPGVCFGRAGNWHHRKSAGRVWTPSNGLHLCGSGTTGCHGWVTDHPNAANDRGWLLRSRQQPRLEPAVITPQGRWCYLTETGLYVPVTNRKIPPAPSLTGSPDPYSPARRTTS